jgi:hypothetical protein
MGGSIFLLLLLAGAGIYFIYKKNASGTNKNNPVTDQVAEYFVKRTSLSGPHPWGGAKYDDEYDELVKNQISIDEVKTRAFEKLGLDKSELTEIEPIHFENYYFGNDDDIDQFVDVVMSVSTLADNRERKRKWQNANIIMGIGKDGKMRSSAYQVTWLFSTPKQVCIYQEIIYLHKNETDEITRQYLWKHITSITGLRNTLKKKKKSGQKTEKVDVFQLTVAGDTFICYMTPTDYTTKSINAMKQRLLDFSN